MVLTQALDLGNSSVSSVSIGTDISVSRRILREQDIKLSQLTRFLKTSLLLLHYQSRLILGQGSVPHDMWIHVNTWTVFQPYTQWVCGDYILSDSYQCTCSLPAQLFFKTFSVFSGCTMCIPPLVHWNACTVCPPGTLQLYPFGAFIVLHSDFPTQFSSL